MHLLDHSYFLGSIFKSGADFYAGVYCIGDLVLNGMVSRGSDKIVGSRVTFLPNRVEGFPS